MRAKTGQNIPTINLDIKSKVFQSSYDNIALTFLLIEKPPVKKAAAGVDKRMMDEMNAMQSPIKNSSLAKAKATSPREGALEKIAELSRSYNGKEATKAINNGLRGTGNLKNNAMELRKEHAQKHQKTLTSRIIYSNNSLLEIDQLIKQAMMNSNDPGIANRLERWLTVWFYRSDNI